MGWTMLYLFVFLKLPILAACYIVWWAIHQTDDTEEVPNDGGTKVPRRPHPRQPRHPRAHHGEAPHAGIEHADGALAQIFGHLAKYSSSTDS